MNHQIVLHLFALFTAALLASTFVGPLAQPGRADGSMVSIRDLMTGIVEPSATVVFEAAAVENGPLGPTERGPSTEAEWARVQRHALRLIETAALLQAPGRRVMHGAESARLPHAPRLTVGHMQRLIDSDRRRWNRYAGALAETAGWAVEAASQRSFWRLISAGGDISLVCETCHLAYRHPDVPRYLSDLHGH